MDEFAELDEGGAVYQVLDVEGGEADQICLFLAVFRARWRESEERMPDLLDVNRPAETGFLAVVALDFDPVFLIVDTVCCDGRVVGNLLGD